MKTTRRDVDAEQRVTCEMVQSFRKRKEDFSRNMKTLLCLKHVGLMVMAGLKSDAWVQTLIPLRPVAGQVPSPWASAFLSGKDRGGSSSAEVLKPVRGITGRGSGTSSASRTHTGMEHLRAWGRHSAKSRLNICANGMDRKHSGLGGGVGVSPSTGQAPLYPYSPWGTGLPPSWGHLATSGDGSRWHF